MIDRVGSYIVTYRWELWLIVGIPAIGSISIMVSGLSAAYFIPDGNVASQFTSMVGSVVSLFLQALSFLRVRNLGRNFFFVLWGYVVAASVIWATAQGILFLISAVFPAESNFTVVGRTLTVLGLSLPVQIVALLWFARSASRLSLTHSVFLLVFSSLNIVGSVAGSSVAGTGTLLLMAQLLAWAAIGLTVALTKVWLLGNFERHDSRFRRNAVIGLLATLILSGYARAAIAHLIGYAEGPYLTVLPLLGTVIVGLAAFLAATAFELAFLAVLVALVYVVRVRTPGTDDESEPETPTATPNEER